MKTRYKMLLIPSAILLIFFFGFKLNKSYNSLNNEMASKVIKVGAYEYNPCYYIDDNKNVKGYYDEVIKAISKYDEYDYEYEISSFDQALNKLESGEVDIIVGLNKSKEREENIVYSKHPIGVERYGLYSMNMDDNFADLESLENQTLGIVKNGANGAYIKSVFENKNININIVEFEEQKDMLTNFSRGNISLSIQPINKNNEGKIIYEFSSGQVYIAGLKGSEEIISNIDKTIVENAEALDIYMTKAYKKYFKLSSFRFKQYENIFIFIASGIFIASILFILSKRNYLKFIVIQRKIKDRIENDEYVLYYQSIFNPNEEQITGFEALLRQKDKNGKILPPSEFLDEIESNDMLYDISLWVLEKAIKDYKEIQKKYDLKNEKYISVNISVAELISDDFVNKSIELIKKYDLPKNSICFEIIERVKAESINQLSSSVNKLREAGYLIAIDDFGMEYSNLDILGKIEFDIIKLDRYFIYAISKEYVKEEILKFLSAISKRANSVLVVEGVETEEQINLLKKIDNDKIYVQGYYYSKPAPI